MLSTIPEQQPQRRMTFWRDRYFPLYLLALLLSLFCKLLLMKSRELRLDETYSVFAASMHFQDLLRFISGDVHPQLFSILLWGWIHAFGTNLTKLHLFSILFNVGGMVGMYFLGRSVIGPRWGTFAAFLFAFSPMLLVYSLDVRSYSLFLLVFVCALAVYWQVAMQEGSRRLIATLPVLLALLFYVHYLALFLVSGLFLHWFACWVASSQRNRLSTLGFTMVVTFLLIAPGIPLLIKQHGLKVDLDRRLELSHSNPAALSFTDSTHKVFTGSSLVRSVVVEDSAMAGFYPVSSKKLLFLYGTPLLCTLVGAAYYGLRRGDEVCLLFFILCVSLQVGLVLLNLNSTRYVLPLAPVLALTIARVLQRWSSHKQMHFVALLLALFISVLYGAGFLRQMTKPPSHPWNNLVEALQKDYKPGDIVIFDVLYAQVPFDYIAGQRGFHPRETGFPVSIYQWWATQEHHAWGGPVVMRSDLENVVHSLTTQRVNNIWIVSYETYYYDPHLALLASLATLGSVAQVALPLEGDSSTSSENSPDLRLFLVSQH